MTAKIHWGQSKTLDNLLLLEGFAGDHRFGIRQLRYSLYLFELTDSKKRTARSTDVEALKALAETWLENPKRGDEMTQEKLEELVAALDKETADNPIQPVQDEPVAWRCEEKLLMHHDEWVVRLLLERPEESKRCRNIVPLYEEPQPAPGELVDNPWEQVGFLKEKLRQAEQEREVWRERAMTLRTAGPPPLTVQDAVRVPEIAALIELVNEFCRRAKNGQVRSKRTYSRFSAALHAIAEKQT